MPLTPAQTMKAIQKQWPGAMVVLNGGVVERWDGPGAQPSGAQIQAALDAYTPAVELSDAAQGTSRQKDVLTDCAMLVRARIGIAAWNALTTPQKVSQTLAEADVWKTVREFIDDKV